LQRRHPREGETIGGVIADYDIYQTPEELKAAFARRQQEDLLRRQRLRERQQQQHQQGHGQGRIIAELEEIDGGGGYEPWTNSEGERLWDYGVDEDVEEDRLPSPESAHKQRNDPNDNSYYYGQNNNEDDDVPLAELIRRRKVLTKDGEW
jgi:palmitoyltransferase